MRLYKVLERKIIPVISSFLDDRRALQCSVRIVRAIVIAGFVWGRVYVRASDPRASLILDLGCFTRQDNGGSRRPFAEASRSWEGEREREAEIAAAEAARRHKLRA